VAPISAVMAIERLNGMGKVIGWEKIVMMVSFSAVSDLATPRPANDLNGIRRTITGYEHPSR
jgi:hypothetical protein